MIRPALFIGMLIVILPQILISEPKRDILVSQNISPVEILFSGVTSLDTGDTVLIRINDDSDSPLVSTCPDAQIVTSQTQTSRVISWELEKPCPIPIVHYKGMSYIVPVSGSYPDLISLSDISNETLRNTLSASAIIKNDFRFSSNRLRQFFSDIETLLVMRDTKFSYPILSSPLPSKASIVPNAPRPFRAKTTDGVHHGWDFYVKKGTPVRAIEDGTIIQVKRDFDWDEMDHLQDARSELGKQKNLDVYRGNTVYLKTVSGHVAIYAHLNDIPESIQNGTVISRGQVVGHVGDSAVPDKKYLYHLHFEIAMNPFDESKAGKYTFEDILLWDFWGKGKELKWVQDNGKKIFE